MTLILANEGEDCAQGESRKEHRDLTADFAENADVTEENEKEGETESWSDRTMVTDHQPLPAA